MKILGNIILFIIIVLIFGYIAFLTILPMMLDKKLDRVAIKKNIFAITSLNADMSSIKSYTTSSLGIGVKFKTVELTYSDNKPFLKTPKIEIEINALPLLFKTIKFNKISATTPSTELFILQNKEYKITDYLNTNYRINNFLAIYPKLSKYTFELSPITLKNYRTEIINSATNQNETLEGAEQIIPKYEVIDYIKPYLNNKDNKTLIKIK